MAAINSDLDTLADAGPSDYDQMVMDAYAQLGREGFGSEVNQIDPEGFQYWTDRAAQENLNPDQFQNIFNDAVSQYFVEKPDDPYTNYITDNIVRDAYGDIGRNEIGNEPNQIDQQGYDYWRDQLTSGALSPDTFDQAFTGAVDNAINSPQSETPAPVKDYVIDYLRTNPIAKINLPARTPAVGETGGVGQIGVSSRPAASAPAPSVPYMGAPVSYGGNNQAMMDTGGAYASPLIQALRQQSNERFSTNPGIQRYATTQPNSGALQPLDPNRQSSIFSPEVQSLTPYDPATDPRRVQISDLYKQVLGRDPDEPGLNSFANSKMTLDQIRAAMLGSPEYTSKNTTTPIYDTGGGN